MVPTNISFKLLYAPFRFDIEVALSIMQEYGRQYIIVLLLDPDVDIHLPKSLHFRVQNPEDRIPPWSNDDQTIQELFWERLSDQIRFEPLPGSLPV